MASGVIDHDHGAVWKIADGLVRIAAFLDEGEFQIVSHRQRRAKGVRQFIQIEGQHALYARQRTEIAVIRQHADIQHLGQLDQLGVGRNPPLRDCSQASAIESCSGSACMC